MREVSATITRQGQVTVPAEVRRSLGLSTPAKVVFVLTDDGEVHLRVPRYIDLDSLQGAAGSLPSPLTWEEMRAIAYEDRFKERSERVDD